MRCFVLLLVLAVVALHPSVGSHVYNKPAGGHRAVRPLSFESWHPKVRTLGSYIVYSTRVTEIVVTSPDADVDLVMVEKETLQQALQAEADAHHARARGDESGVLNDAQEFMDGFWAGTQTSSNVQLLETLPDSVYGCAHGTTNVLTKLYDYFATTVDPSLLDTLKEAATTMEDCVRLYEGYQGNTHNSVPIATFKNLAIATIENMPEIYTSCDALISTLGESTFSAYQVGEDTATCLIRIASVELNTDRRRDITVPDGWECDDVYYNSNDGCDTSCGVIDPDCLASDGSSDSIKSWFEHHFNHKDHKNWYCPESYRGSGDGCDRGCGSHDSDCDDRRRIVTTYTYSSNTFLTVANSKLASYLKDGTDLEVQHSSASSSNDTAIVLGCVAAACFVAFVVVSLMLYKETRKSRVVRGDGRGDGRGVPDNSMLLGGEMEESFS